MKTKRVLATIQRVSPRSSFSYPCCDRCSKKLGAATLQAQPNHQGQNSNHHKQRAPLGDVSNCNGLAASTTDTGSAAVSANPVRVHVCGACRAVFSEDSVRFRYNVSLVVSIQGSLKNVTVFGSSLDPLFGMACTPLSHTLRRNSLNDMGTQSPSIDGRRVLNALDQVATNMVVLLIVKPSMFDAICDLSETVANNLSLDIPQQSAKILKSVAGNSSHSSRSRDFVVSSVEFPVAPAVTVAHLLGLLSPLPIRLPPPSLNNLQSVFDSSDSLDSFAEDMLDGLSQHTPTLFPQTMNNHGEGMESKCVFLSSPPSTPRRNLPSQTLNINDDNNDDDDNIGAPLSTLTRSANGAQQNFEEVEITALSPHKFFGIPSPPRTTSIPHNPENVASQNTATTDTSEGLLLVPESPPTLLQQLSNLTLVEDSPPATPRHNLPSRPFMDVSSPFFVAGTPLTSQKLTPVPQQYKQFANNSMPTTPSYRVPSAFASHLRRTEPGRNITPLGKRPVPYEDENDNEDEGHTGDLNCALSQLRVSPLSSAGSSSCGGSGPGTPQKRTRISRQGGWSFSGLNEERGVFESMRAVVSVQDVDEMLSQQQQQRSQLFGIRSRMATQLTQQVERKQKQHRQTRNQGDRQDAFDVEPGECCPAQSLFGNLSGRKFSLSDESDW